MSDGAADARPLVAIDAASLLDRAVLFTAVIRRLARSRNHLVAVGKAQSAFVNEPDFPVLTIGMGHGGPLDASAVEFANPGMALPPVDGHGIEATPARSVRATSRNTSITTTTTTEATAAAN